MFPNPFPCRAALAVLALAGSAAVHAEPAGMTFFVTSTGTGQGADLGGLAGADAHCQKLAEAAGAGRHTWRAYLSASASARDGQPAVNARERIGKGPWHNAKGELIAKDVAQLHGDNLLTKQTGIDERGMPVKGRGDAPNTHDILTGSQADGTAFVGDEDRTCGNWTSSTTGAAMVGHHDRVGRDDSAEAHSWNSAHLSRGGCSSEALASSGGAGLLYCFAAD